LSKETAQFNYQDIQICESNRKYRRKNLRCEKS